MRLRHKPVSDEKSKLGAHSVRLVQSWSSLDGENPRSTLVGYHETTDKSLFYEEATVRWELGKVPMDHLPRLQVEHVLPE